MKWYLGFALKHWKKWEGIDETRWKMLVIVDTGDVYRIPLSLSTAPFIYMFKMFYDKVKNKNK